MALSRETLPERLPEGFLLERPARGEAVLHSGFPITRFYILVNGLCAATVYGEDGESAIAEMMEPMQVFGVSELLRGVKTFHASIYAASDDCVLLTCPASVFMSTIEVSLKLSNLMVKYLADLMVKSMQRYRDRAFGSARIAIAEFFYTASAAKKLPFTVEIRRKELAERLHLNLRTLYRHISALQQEGRITIVHGKLTVTEENFEKLEAICRPIGDF